MDSEEKKEGEEVAAPDDTAGEEVKEGEPEAKEGGGEDAAAE